MDEPTDPGGQRQTTDVPCLCGSTDHPRIRIGETLSPSGSAIGPVYICPASSDTGLQGAL